MSKNTIYYLLILIVCFFAFFVNNQVINADLMEARNLATAQEMVSQGNYLTPTLNGELRLEKPPLPTWIAAGIEHIMPDNLIVQRYAAGLAATLMVFFLFLVVRRLTRNDQIAFISALILATCYNVIMMGRTATWDIYCHCFMLGAIYFLLSAFEENGKQWSNFILSGLFMGLSFLSKGPVSFFALLLPFLISYIATYRPSLRKKILPLICMIIVCLAVSFWWPLYILLFHPEMGIAVAQKESGSWIEHNVRPFYYYWLFSAEAGIWTFFWITSLIWFFWKKGQSDRKNYKLSIIWTIAALILLSAIPEKKTRYLLPLLIPGAVNIAFYIYYCIQGIKTKAEKNVFKINATILAVILLLLPVALYIIFVRKDLESIPMFLLTSVISLGLGIYMLKSTYGNLNIQKVFAIVILTMIMVEALCLIPVGHIFINDDRHSIHLVRKAKETKGLPFYYNKNEELRMELVYEANHIIRPLDISDTVAVKEKLPFVFVSGLPVDSILANQNVTVNLIDTYDNNWRKRGHKHYNPALVRQVAVVKAK